MLKAYRFSILTFDNEFEWNKFEINWHWFSVVNFVESLKKSTGPGPNFLVAWAGQIKIFKWTEPGRALTARRFPEKFDPWI